MSRRRRGKNIGLCRAALAFATALAVACARNDDDTSRTDGDERAGPDDTAAARQPVDSAAASSMADGAILDVALTANTMEVHISELGRFRAQDSNVRRFAQTMVPDHSAVNGELQSLAGRANIAPITDERSSALRAAANAELAELDSLYGAAFDQAYIKREVEYHQQLVELFDQTLIPAATNPRLKTLLERVRPMLAAHLERARQLRAANAASTAGAR